jgi:ribosomal-protein-serine acetyltransferase
MSPNIRIRPFRPDDASAFHAAVIQSIPELQPWMPWCHPQYAMDEAAAWTALQARSFEARTEFEFLVVDDSDSIVGAAGLNQIDAGNRRANVGYWMRSSATGKGIATAAVKLLLSWVAANTDLHRYEIVIAADNVGSIRVAEKVGAVREGVLQQRLLLHGRFHDAVMFAVIRGMNLPA